MTAGIFEDGFILPFVVTDAMIGRDGVMAGDDDTPTAGEST